MPTCDLVLEGGGVKGIALVGAVQVLIERGYHVERVAGTSAGSIIGSLIAAGMDPARMVEAMRAVDYRRFRDPPTLGRWLPPVQVWTRHGWWQGDYLRGWLGELLGEQGVTTFGSLPERLIPAADGGSPLVVCASDLTRGALARLPWDYPTYGLEPATVPVVDAVRASMAIPVFYTPVKMPGGEWLVDGMLLSNFPVAIFDRPTGLPPRWPTFGIKLASRAEYEAPANVRGIFSMGRAMATTMARAHDRMHIAEPGTLARTMFVDTFGVSPLEFGIDAGTVDRLYESGRDAATRFLDGWDFDAYRAQYRRG